MSVPDGHDRDVQILLMVEQTSLAQTLASYLANGGYSCAVVRNERETLTILKSSTIAAVIAVSSSGTINLLKSLQHHIGRYLRILVVPDDSTALVDKQVMSLVNTVLPASSPYLEIQLQTLLKLHSENQGLRAQISRLEKEVTVQKSISGEMEILKNAIVRNVSHELGTPLLQVKSAVSLIKEEVADQKLITYAENATARLETHVKNITMLGHSLDINIGPIILRDAVEYARRNLGRVWQRKTEADRILIQLQANLPPILADKQGLSTVMQLLMDNALKFSENPIEVVGRKQDNGTVYVAVRDAGIGIAPDKVQDIFESFYQIDSSSTRRYGGAGVGLALVKLILDHHESAIHVESELGKGSTFWFQLPYVEMPVASGVDAESAESMPEEHP